MKIAIRGHKSRGKEVIQTLENLGGKNTALLKGVGDSYYYLNNNSEIRCHDYKYVNNYCNKYTLEEFEKVFPFKVGDKVIISGLPDYPKVITKMIWEDNEILYTFGDNTWFNTGALRKLEMKKERNIILTLDKAKEWYKKGGELKEIALQAFSEQELTKVELPKTWEEFCENYPVKIGEAWIDDDSEITIILNNELRDKTYYKNICPSEKSAKAHLALIQLEQLRDCWRQGWKPDWSGDSESWCIRLWGNLFDIGSTVGISRFLTFPTKEMAKEFLECFRDLIEKVRDFI